MIVIVLAGGSGKRMNSSLPKVLHCIQGIPMITMLLTEVSKINPDKILVVVGKDIELIKKELTGKFDITYVYQEVPLGTGDAVRCCKDYLPDNSNVLILSGDTPLVRSNTMKSFLNTNITKIGVAKLRNPYGYGRIYEINNKFEKIIEEKDCSEIEKLINKINCGIYCINSNLIKQYITNLSNSNNQNEYYLTDLIGIIKENNNEIDYHVFTDQYEIIGVNTQEQLIHLEENYRLMEYDPPWYM